MPWVQKTVQYCERITNKTSSDKPLSVVWLWQGNEKHFVRIYVCVRHEEGMNKDKTEKEQAKER